MIYRLYIYKSKTKQAYKKPYLKGLTLTELIIVILILAILSAVLAPRIIDISEDAIKGASKTTMASFYEAARLAHFSWQAAGQPDTLSINGRTVPMSAEGYPAPTTPDTAGCIDLWGILLNSSIQLEPIVAGEIVEEWSAFGAAPACLFFNQSGTPLDISTTPAFSYLIMTGRGIGLNVD